MLKTLSLTLVICISVTASAHWKFRVRRWNAGYKPTTYKCSFYGMKSMVDQFGIVKRCVYNCGPGYEELYSYIHGDYCKQLPRGCKNSDCSECRNGYFYVPTPFYFGTRCQRNCPVGYDKNRSNNRCEKRDIKNGCADYLCYRCKRNFFKYVDETFRNNCVKECPEGYGPVKGRCRKIPVGCMDANCSHCEDGYFYYEKSLYFQACRRNCPVGYFADSNINVCVPCSDEKCVQCKDTPFKCNKCRGYYALLRDNFEDDQSCFRFCPKGYKRRYELINNMFVCELMNTEAPVITTNKPVIKTTEAPTESLKTTQQATKPTESPKTASPSTTTVEAKTIRITTEQKLTTKELKTPPVPTTKAPLPEGCEDPFCFKCTKGFYRLVIIGDGTKCLKKCPSGYYATANECLGCSDPRCGKCVQSPFRCEACKVRYLSLSINANETVRCLDECPKEYNRVQRNGTALCERKSSPDCTIENCAKCTNNELHGMHIGCLKCATGFLLKRNIFKDDCVGSCPDGFYAGLKPGTNTSACLDCDVQFCKTCLRRKKCTECYEPFVFDFGKAKCGLCPLGKIYNPVSKSCKSITKEKQSGKKKVTTIEDLLPGKKKKGGESEIN